MNDPLQTVSLNSLVSQIKTGYFVWDFLLATVCSAMLMGLWNNTKEIKAYVVSYFSNLARSRNRKYLYASIIKLDSLSTNGGGSRNPLGINADNDILLNGILHHLDANGMINNTNEQDIINLVTEKDTTRVTNLESIIYGFPKNNIEWNGMLFEFEKSEKMSTSETASSLAVSKKIVIRHNDYAKVKEFLERCKKEEVDLLYPAPVQNDPPRHFYFIKDQPNSENSQKYVFNRYLFESKKSFKSLFFNRKQEVLDTIDHFTNNTGPWIPHLERTHKLCICLYGPPGTGKTSFLKALSNHTGRNPFKIRMPLIRTNEDLLDICSNVGVIFSTPRGNYTDNLALGKRIYFFEDLDCDDCDKIIMRRVESSEVDSTDKPSPSKKMPKEKHDPFQSEISLSGFLNMLDGPYELNDAIIIITTNNINKFDPAILRPGRVDILLEMGYMSSEDIASYLEYYYQCDKVDMLNIEGDITPSKIEQICQSSKTVELALQRLKL